MGKKIRTEAVDHLFDGILSLKTKEECYLFLRMCARSMNCFLYLSGLKLRRC